MTRDDNIKQRGWIHALAERVTIRLRDKVIVPTLVFTPPSRLYTYKSEADGWYVEIGAIRADRGGALQLWLDRWPRTQTRKLWFGYKGTRTDQIRIAASVGTPEFGQARNLLDGAYEFDRQEQASMLREPLRYYGVPIAELYTRGWGFYGIYLRRTPNFSRRPSVGLVARTALFLERIGLAIGSQLATNRENSSFLTALEGHPRYRLHLYRERSPRLARNAKIRDGYTCRICGINFEQLYGPIGHAFAEAHHLIPLSRLKRNRLRTIDNLLTVCANCHRMFHKLPADSAGIASLKKRFTGEWPND